MEEKIIGAARTGRFSLENVRVPAIPSKIALGPEHGGLALDMKHFKASFCCMGVDVASAIFPPSRRCKDTTPPPGASIPERGPGMLHLESLQLGNNSLMYIPDTLGELTNLTALHLHNNYLQKIPESIVRLHQLKELTLGKNGIESVPSGFWSAFPLMEYMSCHHNALTHIDASIHCLPDTLELLDLSYNSIVVLDPPEHPTDDVTMMGDGVDTSERKGGLRALYLQHNKIRLLPEDLFMTMPKLKVLHLENNEIERLPSSLVHLGELISLSLQRNALKTLELPHPCSWDALGNLIEVDLDHNEIHALPCELGMIPHLHVVQASYNAIHDMEGVPMVLLNSLFRPKAPNRLPFAILSISDVDIRNRIVDHLETMSLSVEQRHDAIVLPLTASALLGSVPMAMDHVDARSTLLNASKASTAQSAASWNPSGASMPQLAHLEKMIKRERHLIEHPHDVLPAIDAFARGERSVVKLPVYRQWEQTTCGYHALKNGLLSVLAMMQHKKDECRKDPIDEKESSDVHRERERELILLGLMASPLYFWVLKAHWQSLLVEEAHKRADEADGSAVDVVWRVDTVKEGVLERNYANYLLQSDPLLLYAGREKFITASELGYIESGAMGALQVISLSEEIQKFHSSCLNMDSSDEWARAILLGTSRGHWISVVAFRPRSHSSLRGGGQSNSIGRLQYILADSSDYLDPIARSSCQGDAENGLKVPSRTTSTLVHDKTSYLTSRDTTSLLLDGIEGRTDLRTYYLHHLLFSLENTSTTYVLHPDTRKVIAENVDDWYITVYSGLVSFLNETKIIGKEFLHKDTRGMLIGWVRSVMEWDCADVTTRLRELLQKKEKELRELILEEWDLPV